MSKILELLSNVTESDLKVIQDEIKKIEDKLAGMKRMEKVIAITLGKDKPKTKVTEDKANDIINKRRIVADYLSDGARTSGQIIQNCKISGRQFVAIMDCPWFNKSTQGYHLTPIGRQEM